MSICSTASSKHPPQNTPPDASCSDELSKFEAAAKAAQAVVRYGALNAGGADAQQTKALSGMGVDTAALESSPCGLQVVMLPHGSGKADIDEYKR